MNNPLLPGVLLLALCLAKPAHGRCPSQAAPAQDTTKAESKRLRTSAHLAVAGVRPQAPLGQVEPQRQPDSPEAATAASPEFAAETANLSPELAITLGRPAAPLGRRSYRTRLVRTGRWATSREAVEILTCTYAGPLVLAQLPATATTPAQLLAGPGYDATVALRPLDLTPAAVLRLCGSRAPQVQAYARLYNLHFQQADEVARLLDYYNRIAATVGE